MFHLLVSYNCTDTVLCVEVLHPTTECTQYILYTLVNEHAIFRQAFFQEKLERKESELKYRNYIIKEMFSTLLTRDCLNLFQVSQVKR